MNQLPEVNKGRYATVNPDLVVCVLKLKDKKEYIITKRQKDNIDALDRDDMFSVDGDTISKSMVASIQIDHTETANKIFKTVMPRDPLPKPHELCTPEQFQAMCEAKAANHAGFREIWEAHKAHKKANDGSVQGIMSGVLGRMSGSSN